MLQCRVRIAFELTSTLCLNRFKRMASDAMHGGVETPDHHRVAAPHAASMPCDATTSTDETSSAGDYLQFKLK